MDLSTFPDTVLLKIFRYLPLIDQIRCAGVNRRFRQFSSIVVSETKSLDLSEEPFTKIEFGQFPNLLNLCVQKLESIKFPFENQNELVEVFASYSFPRLTELIIDGAFTDNEIFVRLIRVNLNLISFSWYTDDPEEGHVSIEYPDDEPPNEKLETLKLSDCDDGSIRSLIGHFPNLKTFHTTTYGVSLETWDDFFLVMRNIEELDIDLSDCEAQFADLTHFWSLPSLKSLNIDYWISSPFLMMFVINDQFLTKVAQSFDQLRKLSLWCGNVSSIGIATLASLKNLENIQLTLSGQETDWGMQELQHCKRLQSIEFPNSRLSWTTVTILIRSCPELKHFKIRGLVLNATEFAMDIAQLISSSLAGLGSRRISLVFGNDSEEEYRERKAFLKSASVERALKELKDTDGFDLAIELERGFEDYPN